MENFEHKGVAFTVQEWEVVPHGGDKQHQSPDLNWNAHAGTLILGQVECSTVWKAW